MCGAVAFSSNSNASAKVMSFSSISSEIVARNSATSCFTPSATCAVTKASLTSCCSAGFSSSHFRMTCPTSPSRARKYTRVVALPSSVANCRNTILPSAVPASASVAPWRATPPISSCRPNFFSNSASTYGKVRLPSGLTVDAISFKRAAVRVSLSCPLIKLVKKPLASLITPKAVARPMLPWFWRRMSAAAVAFKSVPAGSLVPFSSR